MKFQKKGKLINIIKKPTINFQILTPAKNIIKTPNKMIDIDVPIIVTDSDTLTSMKALIGVQNRARFNHPAKLARFSELLRRHADLDTIRTRLAPVA